MAVVQGIREKVHLPLYDSLSVDSEKQLRDAESSSTMKFFINVQGKTKLETNLQSASLLPHYNTFEARAMRVVISDLPPEFPDKTKVTGEELPVVDDEGEAIHVKKADGTVDPTDPPPTTSSPVEAKIEIGLDRVMELLREAREDADKTAFLELEEGNAELTADDLTPGKEVDEAGVADAGGVVALTVSDLEKMIDGLKDDRQKPPKEQIRPNDGAGTIIGKLVYNTVTTFFVGEKTMISMPTWFFPAGAGPYSETGKFTTHGEPSPTATFRFAEPIYIDKQQNFRVEIEIPDSDTLKEVQKIYGPLKIWVVLDGYMTRDVQ